jgi:hypothetical protein
MRGIVLMLTALVLTLTPAPIAQASVPQPVTIATTKDPGPVPGTFTLAGAITDAGTLTTLNLHFSAVPAPDHLITHLTLRFDGASGSFTVKAQVRETPTSNPEVFANEGVWEIIGGTGAYAKLHGGGRLTGTVADVPNGVNRTFIGEVHTD